MLNLTPKNIFDIAGTYSKNKQNIIDMVPFFNKYLSQYEINNVNRLKHFFGQACEECSAFSDLTEVASGKEYEGRRDLGNVDPGDGVKYKGRGIFQVTGRSNYEIIGKRIGIDLVSNPLIAASPEVSVITACVYWTIHEMNAIADSTLSFEATLEAITRKINGGENGLSVRRDYTLRAASVLSQINLVDTKTPDIKPPVPVAPVANTVPLVLAVANTKSATANVPAPNFIERVLTWVRSEV